MSIQLQTHGGDIYAFEREILDFSASINPLGAPESVIKAARESLENTDRYPDDKCRALRCSLAKKHGVSVDNIICGNGAEELIYAVMQALRPKSVLVLMPTFSEYERAARAVGADIIKYTLDEKNGFSVTEDILGFVGQADMTVICDPNNPTGKTVDADLLERIIQNSNITLVDRSFADFGERQGTALCPLSLFSFTKMYAIPALRLGYAVCEDKKIIEKINAAKPRWSVSVPAQAAGLAALNETEYVKKSIEYINAEKRFLYRAFDEMGIEYFKSDVNFILFKSERPLYSLLLEKCILIRDCTSFGLNGFYRVAVRTHEENERLVKALREVCL